LKVIWIIKRQKMIFHLEHICPYKPNEIWSNAFGEGYDEVKDRIGNMLLLPKRVNKDVDTKPFIEKNVCPCRFF